MKINRTLAGSVMMLGLMLASQVGRPQTAQKQEAPKTATKKDTSAKPDTLQPEGDRIFQQQCSR